MIYRKRGSSKLKLLEHGHALVGKKLTSTLLMVSHKDKLEPRRRPPTNTVGKTRKFIGVSGLARA